MPSKSRVFYYYHPDVGNFHYGNFKKLMKLLLSLDYIIFHSIFSLLVKNDVIEDSPSVKEFEQH